jgi:non-lysosomal glucosylceramidase
MTMKQSGLTRREFVTSSALAVGTWLAATRQADARVLSMEPADAVRQFPAPGFTGQAVGVVYDAADVKQGVPLGGLGTGYIDLNADGTLGLCSIFNQFVPPRKLNTPFLGLVVDGQARLVGLRKTPGMACAKSGRYWGHFPVADASYAFDLPVTVDLRAWSPLVLGDAAASNTPAICFAATVRNQSQQAQRVRLVLNFPGPTPQKPKTGDAAALAKPTLKREPVPGGVMVSDARGSYALAWIDPAQTSQGTLRDWRDLNQDKPLATPAPTDPSAAIAVEFTVPAGQSHTATAVLAWYQPHWKDSGGQPHTHRYAQRFKSSQAVLRFMATNHAALLRRTLAWQQAIYDDERLPLWLREGLVNTLYSLAKNTFWVVNIYGDDWYGPDGLFVHSESFTGCPISETMVCRIHGHFPALLFFPELERSTLRAFAHWQIRSGEVPFAFGGPTALWNPRYYCQHPINSAQWVLMVHRYVERTGDEAFAREMWPAVQAAIRFARTLDTDGDGLVNDKPHCLPGEWWPANQFYDIWPWHGASAYVAGVNLAALRAAEALATRLGQTAAADELSQARQRGLKQFDAKLWTGKYYRVFHDTQTGQRSEGCLANQLMGEWCTRIAGLGGLFPAERAAMALASIERLNFRATAHGLVNCCIADGHGGVQRGDPTSDPRDAEDNSHAKQIFVGENSCAAMTLIYGGQRTTGLEVLRRMWQAMTLLHRTPWNQFCVIRSTDGGPVWGSDYYSNLVLWAVPVAMGGDIKQFASTDPLLRQILGRSNARGSEK